MPSPAHESNAIMAEVRRGQQRRAYANSPSIGQRSADLKRQHALRKVLRMTSAVVAVLVAAMIAGLIIDGIGFTGIMVTALAIGAALFLFGSYPRLKVPEQASLSSGSLRQMVGNTELWLEAQRPALPAPAVQLIDQIGVQLDGLGVQLEGLDESQPAVAEVRKLVGEHLPELVSTYTSIPRQLRSEVRAGRTPDDQLADSLGKISAEIDSVTRQLADGAIDKLAIRTRYLDYKYGAGVDGGIVEGEEIKP